jgi:superfamily I DNA and/or RNA helicase
MEATKPAFKMENLKVRVISAASIIFCTVSTRGSRSLAGVEFDVAIIDEAAQLVEAETLIVLTDPQLRMMVLCGDHKQLPGTVLSTIAVRSLLSTCRSLRCALTRQSYLTCAAREGLWPLSFRADRATA